RSTWGSSSLCTTSASEAKHCWVHSLSCWSVKTPESNKSDSSKDVSATFVPFCITTLQPRLHGCSTHVRLLLAEISVMATYFLCAFTACLRPNDCSLRPGSMEMGFRCSPSPVSPPFTMRHLTYATSCPTKILQ